MPGLSQLINVNKEKVARIARVASAFASRLGQDKRGNILTIFAIALPLVVGGLGLGVEGANWYQTKRAIQNAADEAVVAAATNNSSNYLDEARAVTAKYGFTNGSANVSVTGSNAATCPDGTTTCYSVTITKKVPLIFSSIIGFTGNSTIGTGKAELITSTAVASYQTSPRNYCVLALASSAAIDSAVEFLSNGGPKADLSGCSIMSNASMTCNGHDLTPITAMLTARTMAAATSRHRTSRLSQIPMRRLRRTSRRIPARAIRRSPGRRERRFRRAI